MLELKSFVIVAEKRRILWYEEERKLLCAQKELLSCTETLRKMFEAHRIDSARRR